MKKLNFYVNSSTLLRVFKTTSRDQRHILCVKVTLIVDLHIVSFSAPSQEAAMIILKGVFSNL